jgi:hypothetical protein
MPEVPPARPAPNGNTGTNGHTALPAPANVPVPALEAAPPPARPPAPSPVQADRGEGDAPGTWPDILALLKGSQPALCAVLEHGVPVQVDPAKLLLSFPEGSFFGRQAASEAAQKALAEAAARVLGQRPRIEIAYGLTSGRATVAAQHAAQKKERRDELREAALNHPRVKEAMDVFPEAEGQVDVQVLEVE